LENEINNSGTKSSSINSGDINDLMEIIEINKLSRLCAEELRKGVKELLVYHLSKSLGKCTLSFGVAVFPEHGMTSEGILKSADNALCRAKNEGRDRVVVASIIN